MVFKCISKYELIIKLTQILLINKYTIRLVKIVNSLALQYRYTIKLKYKCKIYTFCWKK